MHSKRRPPSFTGQWLCHQHTTRERDGHERRNSRFDARANCRPVPYAHCCHQRASRTSCGSSRSAACDCSRRGASSRRCESDTCGDGSHPRSADRGVSWASLSARAARLIDSTRRRVWASAMAHHLCVVVVGRAARGAAVRVRLSSIRAAVGRRLDRAFFKPFRLENAKLPVAPARHVVAPLRDSRWGDLKEIRQSLCRSGAVNGVLGFHSRSFSMLKL